MRKIETGHTNKVFEENGEIIIQKNHTGFNHKIDYRLLSSLDFVPKLISNNENEQRWEKIEGEILEKPTYDDIVQIAKSMRKVHKSELKFPKNNLRQRANAYLKIIHEKGIHVSEIEDNWKYMMRLLSKMNNQNPSHNDIWRKNLIKDKNGKIWFVDWEYATMGDKHFDLAFYIESQYLTDDEENILLQAYNATENFQAYIPQWMDRYKLLVNWITLIWAYAQEVLPFSVEPVQKRVRELAKKLY